MSMFYCVAHDRMEDSDATGYEVTNAGEEMCWEAYDEMMGMENTGWYDVLQEYIDQPDNDPSPYDGTYSEE